MFQLLAPFSHLQVGILRDVHDTNVSIPKDIFTTRLLKDANLNVGPSMHI
jgi:hypothetical protein